MNRQGSGLVNNVLLVNVDEQLEVIRSINSLDGLDDTCNKKNLPKISSEPEVQGN